MSEMSDALGEYLRAEFERKNEREGRSFQDPLTWRELAKRMTKTPENNLLRWKDGLNVPSSPDQIAELVTEFGAEVLVILGIIDRDIAFFVDYRNHPDVKRVIQEARKTAHDIVAKDARLLTVS